MKASKLLLLMVCLFIGSIVYGQSSHPLGRSTIISNLNDYPDITFLEVAGPWDEIYNINNINHVFIIEPNQSLSRGKLTQVRIYAVNKGYLIDKDINSIDWTDEIHALKVPVPIYYYNE